jgi:MFS family permease
MSVEAYLNPDFTAAKKLLFLLVTAVLIGIGIGFIYLVSLLVLGRDIPVGNRRQAVLGALEDKVQRFFEMIIAGTSVMSFSCAYVIINHVNTLVQSGVAGNLTPVEQRLIEAWTDGKDFVLLLLICLSCVINTILDSLIIPLKKLSKAEKATMRMLAMFYVIILLMYLNYIGDESQYSPVMMYYFGLMIGRFVYFDASFKDFLQALKNMFFNLPYMALNLILTGVLCGFGFGVGYFLERNYFIMGIFYTHLFMLVCIFVIHLVWMIVKCASNKDKE